MEIKLFEIRDSCTFIPAYAVSFRNSTEEESYLSGRAGYEKDGKTIIFGYLAYPEKSSYDSIDFLAGRTMKIAMEYVRDNWESVKSGDVIDVEWILGEKEDIKVSERIIDMQFRELEDKNG